MAEMASTMARFVKMLKNTPVRASRSCERAALAKSRYAWRSRRVSCCND